MSKNILKFLTGFLVTLSLAGCIIVINNEKPTPDEQALINIQSEASDQINHITEKIEKGVFLFQEIVDQVHKNEAGMPQKPIFNVFHCTDELQKRLNIAIEVVKLEKKWVVF